MFEEMILINDNHKLSVLSFTRDLEIIITAGGASSANSMNLRKNFLSLICVHLHLPVINLTLQAKEVRKLNISQSFFINITFVSFVLRKLQSWLAKMPKV